MTYVNLELLPALIITGELSITGPIQVDPFHTVPWTIDKAREVLLVVRRDATVQTEYVWTTVQRQQESD